MKRTALKVSPKKQLVNAKVVAAYLGVTEMSVYSLVKGVRGWKRITPLPHIQTAPSGGGTLRPRLSFDLGAVAEWVIETAYKPTKTGPRTRASRKS